jgi:hypothetical protein
MEKEMKWIIRATIVFFVVIIGLSLTIKASAQEVKKDSITIAKLETQVKADSVVKVKLVAQVKAQITGDLNLSQFLAALFFSAIGVLISLLFHANTRDPNTTTSPVKFSWLYLLRDNWKRIILAFLLICVTLKFLPELTGLKLNMFYALCIGLAWDKLAQYLQSKTDIIKVPGV